MQQLEKKLTLKEFLAMPESDVTHELVKGEAVPKMSPKRFHSALQKTLLFIIDKWCQGKGEVYPEWAIALKRRGKDWVPVPDLTYISYQRLPTDVMEDEPCPVPPELAIEIISQGQRFGTLIEKATDYLEAGVLRVWVVDPHARSITVFYPDAPPRTYTKDMVITDSLFEGLELTPQQVFGEARLPEKD